VFAPARLAIMTQALDDRTSLAFSDTDLIDDADAPASGAYATMLRERIDRRQGPSGRVVCARSLI
jgi:hypothetical protein